MWCAVALDNGTAVDLGRQAYALLDGRIFWFPRGCPVCATAHGADKAQRVDETYGAYIRHLGECTGCATEDAPCEDGEQLRAAHRKAVRS